MAAGKSTRALLTNSTGTCPYGPACHFAHEQDKIAICKKFLFKGSCPAGDYCPLSHDTEPDYHRVPACTHFLTGNCTNDACRFPHVRVSASAPICQSFALRGYCAKGAECAKRHVFECPFFANDGHCPNFDSGECKLPHIRRASADRKAAKPVQAAHNADVDSANEEEDEELDDVDSDEDVVMLGVDDTHALSQQQDFVAFS